MAAKNRIPRLDLVEGVRKRVATGYYREQAVSDAIAQVIAARIGDALRRNV